VSESEQQSVSAETLSRQLAQLISSQQELIQSINILANSNMALVQAMAEGEEGEPEPVGYLDGSCL
jgi:hypothetical protein